MKGFFRFIVITAIVIIIFSMVMYKSPLYTYMANYSLNKRELPKLKSFLEDSYLYDSSNLNQLPYKFNGVVMLKLKRSSIYNPKDTRALVDDFIDLYYGTFEKMSLFFYPFRTFDIKFFLNGSEEMGPIYYYKNNELINNYAEIRENIIKIEAESLKEKRVSQKMSEARAKEKRLSNKAFGFINFGDSKEEAMQKLEQDPRVKIDELMVSNPTYKVNLGGSVFNLKPIYKENNLVLMNFVSDSFRKEQYNENFREVWQNTINYFTRLHGETTHSFVTSEQLVDDYIEWTSQWKIDKKSIQVGLSRNGSFYHIVVWISHEDYQLNKF